MDSTDEPPRRLLLRGNIPGLVASGLIEGTAWQMQELIWQPYIISLGGSMAVIGGFQSLWILLTHGLQFITGELCDAWGRKRSISIYYVGSVLGLTLSILARDWRWLIPAIIIYSIADGLADPSFYPIYVESVDEKQMGFAISLLSLSWFLPGLYSKLLAGYIGEDMGLVNVLKIALAGIVLASLVFELTVKETLKQRRRVDWDTVRRNLLGAFKPRKDLRAIYMLSILNRFALQVSFGIFVAMLYEGRGFSLLQIGLLLTIATASTTLSLIPAGRLVDRIGSTLFLRASVLLSILSFGGFILSGSYRVYMLLQVFRGLAVGLWDPSFNSLISKAVPSERRGSLYGSLNGLRGFISFPAPMIGAYVFNSIGFRGPFMVSVLASLVSLVYCLRIRD